MPEGLHLDEASKKMQIQKYRFGIMIRLDKSIIPSSGNIISFKPGMTGICISDSKIPISGKFFIGFDDFSEYYKSKSTFKTSKKIRIYGFRFR